MFHIRSARRTVDSKIDENHCRPKQKYELIKVMGILYRCITLTASNCISLTVIYPFQWKQYNVVCIFGTSARAICRVNGFFLYFVALVFA